MCRIVLKVFMKKSMVLLAKPARMGVPLAMSLNLLIASPVQMT